MASFDASFMEMCWTAASACGPARRMSPMWLTSKMPTPVRTAVCSLMIPPPIDAGYSTGMSQPLNSTIFAPIWRWTAWSAVLRMAGAWTDDKIDLNQRAVAGCRDGVTDYRNTRFFGGSNRRRTHHGGHGGTRRFASLRHSKSGGSGKLISEQRPCRGYRPNWTVTREPAGTWLP